MAARYWVGGGSSANWNATGNTNWGTASGVQDNASVPTSTDDVTFDGAGVAGNTNSTISATITVRSLTITSGYTSTMTHNAVLTIAGNWNYQNAYTIAGSSSITISAASTITSNGVTWPNSLTISGAMATYTISGNLTVARSTSVTGRNARINATTSETLFTSGLSHTSANGTTLTGTIKIELTGGTWSGNANVLSFNVSKILLNGNVTVSGSIPVTTTLEYVSGTITVTGSTLKLTGTCTLDTDGMSWNNVDNQGTLGTWTLLSNFSCSGSLIITTGTTTINKTAAETFTIAGGITVNAAIAGTAEVILTGGTWSGSNTTGIANNLTFQGNVTVSGNVYYRTGTLTYVSGTPVVTSSTLNLTASCTLATNGMSWNTVSTTTTTGQTYTINSLLSATTLGLGITAAQTFAGTSGFTVLTLSVGAVSGMTINLKESITYTITTSFSCSASRVGSIVLFTSSHASTRANILMPNNGSNLCNVLASFTRIDASGGRSINTFGGTITDCVNVNQYYDYKPVAL